LPGFADINVKRLKALQQNSIREINASGGVKDLSAGFVAIDFETANHSRTSACAIGLAVVQNQKVVETFTALIRPEPFWFLPDFTDIHGISEEDVKDAKDFGGVWPEIEQRINGRRLLAHNAPFDRSVLNACLRLFRIKFPQPEFICTCRIAKAAFPASPNHKLNTICSRMKIALDHHKAESDALACAQIALKLCADNKAALTPGLLKPTIW
jgi:DNA polymerase-3 subunit epsilon